MSARARVVGCALAAVAAAAVVQSATAPARAGDAQPGELPKKKREVAPRHVPKPCDVLLMVSGREQGHTKPCGCSSPQRGGLTRRAVLWEDARKVAKASLAFSIGDSLADTAIPEQNDRKAELLRGALDRMGYAGMVLSPEDLHPFWTFLSQSYGRPETTPRPPFNVKMSASGAFAELERVQREQPVLRATAGDLAVRVVSLADPTTADALRGVADAVIDPATALAALGKEPGLLIVAAHVLREDLARIASAAAQKADLVVLVDVRGDAAERKGKADVAMDKPLFVTFDEDGKEVALVRLVRGKTGWTASWEPVPLDPPYDEGESPARREVDALFDAYRKTLRDAKLLEGFAAMPEPGPTYVGDQRCANCHRAIHEEWQETPHGDAFHTLVEAKSEVDPECVGCHVVGWSRDDVRRIWGRAEGGFWTAEKTPGMTNVQCESCHGPGSAHVVAQTPATIRRAVTQAACVACHDADNSVHFDYATWLPKVDHRNVPKAQRSPGK